MLGFPGGTVVRCPPAMQEAQVWSLGQEGPLKEGMATHSSILARRIPWTEEPAGLQSVGLQRVRHNWSDCTRMRTVWAVGVRHSDSVFYVCTWLPSGPTGKEPTYQCRRQEMQVWSLGWEDPLQKEIATQSSILVWKILWTEELGRLQSVGSQRAR